MFKALLRALLPPHGIVSFEARTADERITGKAPFQGRFDVIAAQRFIRERLAEEGVFGVQQVKIVEVTYD